MSYRFKVVLIASDVQPLSPWVAEKFAASNVDFSFHQCYTREDLEEWATDADVLWLTSSRKGLITEENMDVFKKVGASD